MKSHGANIDLRFEISSDFDAVEQPLWREHPHLSENAKKMLEAFKSPKYRRFEELARNIEIGDATGAEDESLEVYDMAVDLFKEVVDLFNMVSRRDELLHAQAKTLEEVDQQSMERDLLS